MIPSNSYIKLQQILMQRFLKVKINDDVIDLYSFLKKLGNIDFDTFQVEKDINKIMLVGILFAHPNHDLTRRYMFPNYDYLNIRSGYRTDFFWAGYDEIWDKENPDDNYRDFGFRYQNRRSYDINFNDNLFNKFREDLEQRTSWKYSGGVDLILTSVHLGNYNNFVDLDFSNAVVLELDKLFEDRNNEYIPRFIENIFRAMETDENNPILTYTRQERYRQSRNILKEWVLGFLPESLHREIGAILDFAVKDLRR